MSDDRFFDRLREDAAQLRYTPDEAAWTRIPARVRERLREQPTVASMLARWFRPITASFVTLAIVAALSVTWIERRDAASRNETLTSSSLEISVDGDTYSLSE